MVHSINCLAYCQHREQNRCPIELVNGVIEQRKQKGASVNNQLRSSIESTMPTNRHGNKTLSQIWLFYANIIGYLRFVMIIVSIFFCNKAVHQKSFNWAIFAFIFNYTGGWLLDWVDGPTARKYQQCTAFGAGFDWYCDLLAEIVLVFWAAQLQLWIAPLLLIVFALEMGSALIDTNNVAVGYRWIEFAPKHGCLYYVLHFVYPNGHYSKWGTTFWICYSTWACCHILLAHAPADSTHLSTALIGLSMILVPFVVGYILHQVAYLVGLLSGWKEPVNSAIE